MIQNDIDCVLDHLRRIKSGADLNSFKIDKIVALEMHLRFLGTFFKYQNVRVHDFLVKIKEKAKLTVKMLHTVFDECKSNLNLERLESQLLEFIEGNIIIRYKHSYLPEYMDCLGMNLNDVLMCLEGNTSHHSFTYRFVKQLKIVQKKMIFLRYVYVTEINGCVEHEKLESLETRIQFMADNVGHICFSFWVCRNEEETDSKEDDNDISRKPPYLLFLVVLVELEMQKIFLGVTKAIYVVRTLQKCRECILDFPYYIFGGSDMGATISSESLSIIRSQIDITCQTHIQLSREDNGGVSEFIQVDDNILSLQPSD